MRIRLGRWHSVIFKRSCELVNLAGRVLYDQKATIRLDDIR